MGVWANLEPVESTVSTTDTITLARKSRAIEIINDSGTQDLQFKFHASENYSTLMPLESWSAHVWIKTILLNSPSTKSVAYRIRVLG